MWGRARAARGDANTTERYTSDYPAVAPSVATMSYQRLAYHDQDTTGQMRADCTACSPRVDLTDRRLAPGQVTGPAPSLAYDAAGRELPKATIEVGAAAAHLASRLHLHLD